MPVVRQCRFSSRWWIPVKVGPLCVLLSWAAGNTPSTSTKEMFFNAIFLNSWIWTNTGQWSIYQRRQRWLRMGMSGSFLRLWCCRGVPTRRCQHTLQDWCRSGPTEKYRYKMRSPRRYINWSEYCLSIIWRNCPFQKNCLQVHQFPTIEVEVCIWAAG